MRTTLSGYYRNLQFDQTNTAKELFDVTKQISSGQKIQYAHEDTGVFIDTVRLDNEVTTLTQVKQNAQNALQFSTNTDSSINALTSILDTMKTKLISAADGSKSRESLNALAAELRGLENNLTQIANTSIDGKYLFSGSKIKTKTIDDNGVYQGNTESLKAFLGSGLQQTYNINGADLFFGNENDTERYITSNVRILNKSELYPHIMGDSFNASDSKEVYIDSNNTIRDMVGDIHRQDDIDSGAEQYSTTHFYIRGTDSSGDAFKQRISMDGSESVGTLLDKIGEAYGNTAHNDLVTVSLNPYGQIEIKDKMSGSSKLDFHIVAATDFDLSDGTDNANVTNIDDLDVGTTTLNDVLEGNTSIGNDKLLITEFMKSGLVTSSGANNIEALRYDELNFSKNGVNLTSNMSQIVKSDNSYAIPSTKLVDVATGANVVGDVLTLKGDTINGLPYDVQINLSTPGSFVTGNINGAPVNFEIFDTSIPRIAVEANNITYQQLNDVINMVVTGSVPNGTTIDPATGNLFGDEINPVSGIAYNLEIDPITGLPYGPTHNPKEYDYFLENSYKKGAVTLDHQGKIGFKEVNTSATSTLSKLSLSDRDTSNYFSSTLSNSGSGLSFQNNNALTISDPKTDFFKQIDEAITAIELGRYRADGDNVNPRNVGIQNAIQALDDLNNHIFNQHSIAGVQSQTLQRTSDRTDMLIITTQTLRSNTLDVDIAEASLELQQLTLNYQAMLSTVSRISQLSLVNYL